MGWTFDEWSYDERLVVLNEEGTYRIYDIQGEYSQNSLGTEVQDAGVIGAVIHEGGLVALTGQLAFVEVKGWEGGRPSNLASAGGQPSSPYATLSAHLSRLLGLSHPPPSWDVLPPDQTISRHVEVLISFDTTILSVDNLECIDQVCSFHRTPTSIVGTES